MPQQVPTDFLTPGTFHIFNFLRAAGALVNFPLTVALVGMKTAAGTAVVGQIYDATDADTTDALGGQSSEGALMARQAYAVQQFLGGGPAVKITFIVEPGGGIANTQTITFVGTATADGNQIFKIAGRVFVVGIHNQDAPNTIAANAAAEFNKKAAELPVSISVAANVVTLLHPHKGVNGKDVKVSCDQQVAGCVATVATTVVGTGAADAQPALDALANKRYDGIVLANHAAADITEINSDILTRWAPQSKTWGFYFLFEPGTIGTATPLATAANHQSVIISNMEGCLNAPGEGAVTSAILVFSRAQANAGYDKAVVPLYPPAEAIIYTPGEINTAIHAGLTVYTSVLDAAGNIITNRAKCEQMVTSRTTNAANNPDDSTRDIAVPRVGITLALQLDAAKAAIDANAPAGIGAKDSRRLLRILGAGILRAEATATPPVIDPDKVEEDISAMVINPDGTVLGRNNVKIQYHPLTPDHQTVWSHDIIVGP